MRKRSEDRKTQAGTPPNQAADATGATDTYGGAGAPGTEPQPAPTRPAFDPPLAKPDRTRLSGLWIALTSGAVVLLLLLIFILENGQKVEISFFGAHGHLPLGVALLMAAIFGVLVVVIPGGGRMIQLRLLAKRQRARAAALPPVAYEPDQPGTLAPHPDSDAAAGTGTNAGTGAPVTTPPTQEQQYPGYADPSVQSRPGATFPTGEQAATPADPDPARRQV